MKALVKTVQVAAQVAAQVKKRLEHYLVEKAERTYGDHFDDVSSDKNS